MFEIAKLHGYQRETIDFIVKNPKCFCILEMGLGKTVSVLAAIEKLMAQMMVRKVLIIAPLRVAETVWPSEIEKWGFNFRYQVAIGSEKDRHSAFLQDADIVIINRDNVGWMCDRFGKKSPYEIIKHFDMIVIDESTSFKNPGCVRFKKLKKIVTKFDRVVLMSGTPAPNSYLDLWSQVFLLDGGERLGRAFSAFREEYFYSDYMGYKWEIKPMMEKKIQDSIIDLCLSFRAENFLKLPEKIIVDLRLKMPPDLDKKIKKFEKKSISDFGDSEITASNAGVLTGKLQQLSQGAIYDISSNGERGVKEIHDIKLEALSELVETNPTENFLVAYPFQHDLLRLRKKFPYLVEIDEPVAITEWNYGNLKMLAAHPAAAGHGLNLQGGGRIVVWFGMTWSLELFLQFNARLHRQGQQKPVIVYVLLLDDTIDCDIFDCLEKKEGIQNILVRYLEKKQ